MPFFCMCSVLKISMSVYIFGCNPQVGVACTAPRRRLPREKAPLLIQIITTLYLFIYLFIYCLGFFFFFNYATLVLWKILEISGQKVKYVSKHVPVISRNCQSQFTATAD